MSADETRETATPAHAGEMAECSGICLSGYDIGLSGGGIAYPHPDRPAHGDLWTPSGNEWSQRYVADRPDRFPPAQSPSDGVS